jgi:hypothetical protein
MYTRINQGLGKVSAQISKGFQYATIYGFYAATAATDAVAYLEKYWDDMLGVIRGSLQSLIRMAEEEMRKIEEEKHPREEPKLRTTLGETEKQLLVNQMYKMRELLVATYIPRKRPDYDGPLSPFLAGSKKPALAQTFAYWLEERNGKKHRDQVIRFSQKFGVLLAHYDHNDFYKCAIQGFHDQKGLKNGETGLLSQFLDRYPFIAHFLYHEFQANGLMDRLFNDFQPVMQVVKPISEQRDKYFSYQAAEARADVARTWFERMALVQRLTPEDRAEEAEAGRKAMESIKRNWQERSKREHEVRAQRKAERSQEPMGLVRRCVAP